MTIIMYLSLNKLLIVWLSHWRNCLLCISQRCIFHWTNCLLCGLATEQTVYYVSRSDVSTTEHTVYYILERCIYHWTNCLFCGSATEQTVYYVSHSDVSNIEHIVYFVAPPLNKLYIMYLAKMYQPLNKLFIMYLAAMYLPLNKLLYNITLRCIYHWTNILWLSHWTNCSLCISQGCI